MRYLIITYLRKANGQIDEQLEVTKNLKERDIQMANVIMDFKELKIVKCLVEGQALSTDWSQLYTYYHQLYPSVLERLVIEAQGGEVPPEEVPPEAPPEENPPA